MQKKIILICSNCLCRNYKIITNKLNKKKRLIINKFCKKCNKHLLHKETR